MSKGIIFTAPLAAFTLNIIDDFESEEIVEQISFMQNDMTVFIPELVDTYKIDQLMIVGINQQYTEGISRQLVDILKDKDIEIIIAIPEEENAEISD